MTTTQSQPMTPPLAADVNHPLFFDQCPGANVVLASGGGVFDESLSGFAAHLGAAFQAPHIPEHFAKLARAQADERHLFIPLHSALPFSISSELMFGKALPQDAPPVPAHVTHLWLAPAFSRRVLLWSQPEGWRNFFPYNGPVGPPPRRMTGRLRTAVIRLARRVRRLVRGLRLRHVARRLG